METVCINEGRGKMKVKVSEASGVVLDWLVARCEGKLITDVDEVVLDVPLDYTPSRDWAQGGPIVERERIEPYWVGEECRAAIKFKTKTITPNGFEVVTDTFKSYQGASLLEAAMRCYVTSKLGEEVEVPDELIRSI